jgi:hypothetical protein
MPSAAYQAHPLVTPLTIAAKSTAERPSIRPRTIAGQLRSATKVDRIAEELVALGKRLNGFKLMFSSLRLCSLSRKFLQQCRDGSALLKTGPV